MFIRHRISETLYFLAMVGRERQLLQKPWHMLQELLPEKDV